MGSTLPTELETVILAVCGSTGGARDWSMAHYQLTVLCQVVNSLITGLGLVSFRFSASQVRPFASPPLHERLLYRVGRPNCHPLRTVGAGSLDRVLMQSMRPCRAAVRRENTGQVTHSPLGVLLRHRVHLDPDIEGCGVD